jgi:tight adherence protein B
VTALLAAVAVGMGAAFIVVALLLRVRERDTELRAILELPYGEHDVPIAEGGDSIVALLEPGIELAQRALKGLNLHDRITEELMRARMPLRPGEFVLVAAGSGIFGFVISFLLTSQVVVATLAMMILACLPWVVVKQRATKRSKAFEAQLPEALTLISSSLEAGHTFLHSVEIMVEESEAPLNEEFERVLAETRLGDPLLDALQRMADRLRIPDLEWVVQAIRIQQQVGGALGELLMTLAEFMRAREEIRREIQVLTAEGRMSARILGALPLMVFMVIQTLNPAYMKPMLHTTSGHIALGCAAMSVFIGMAFIKRMAKIEV